MTTTNKDFVIKNGLVVQGATGTINGQFIVTEDALSTSLGDYIEITERGAADGVAELDSSQNVLTKTGVVFEGITADSYEVSLQLAADPGSDKTITIPDVTGTIVTTGNTNDAFPSQTGQTNKYLRTDGTNPYWSTVAGGGSSETLTIGTGLTGTSYDGTSAVTIAIDSTVVTTTGSQSLSSKTLTSPTLTSPYISSGGITFEGSTDDIYETIVQVADPTDDRTITFPDATGTVALTSNIPSNTDGVSEGSTNLYFTNERAQDAIGDNLGTGLSYNDTTGAISVDTATIQARVADVSDTEIGYLNGVTSAIQTQIDNKLSLSGGTLTGALTLSGAPTVDLHAATKAYVDSVAEGLHIHASCVAATTANINLSTDLENGDVLDGVTLATNDRVLVKNQSTQSQNGIYVVQASGAAVRATDFDAPAEIDGGDFVFVTGGTLYDNTGWVQVNTVGTVGSDPIVFTQFSGAGTFTAGNGLTLTGNTFSIDTAITADLSTAQTLTNKTISGANNTLTVRLANDVTGTLPIGNGGTNITTYAAGDILYASATDTLSKLAAGTNGHVLTLSSGIPAWAAVPTEIPSQTSNNGKYLTTDGSSLSWATVESGGGDPNPNIFMLMGA